MLLKQYGVFKKIVFMGKSSPNHGERQNKLCNSFCKFELLACICVNNYSQKQRLLDAEFLLRGTKNWWNDTFFKIEGTSL